MSKEVTPEQIIAYMVNESYTVDLNGGIHIVYVEGADKYLRPNGDAPNLWNDRRLLIQFYGGKWRLIHNVDATTEPGKFYTENPMNPMKGAARIAFGQYKAWQFGLHLGTQSALVQVLPVKVHRDINKDGLRSPMDPIETGIFGINQHTTSAGKPPKLVNRYSAGCLVGMRYDLHLEFLYLLRHDYRYRASRKHIFDTTIIDGQKLYEFAQW